jgi:hypothetical protein
MKSKFIVFIAFVLFTQVANAQRFGIKGGLNSAKQSGIANLKSILGFHFGPVVDYKLKKSLYFNSGLLYSLKGAKILSIGDIGDGEIVPLKINCLDIPLNFAYKFSLNETSNFFLQTGPYFGYTLNGKIKTNGKYENIQFGGEGRMKRFDFGLGIASGFEFGSIATSLSYQFGLTNRFDTPDVMVRTKVLQASVAYMFGKSK